MPCQVDQLSKKQLADWGLDYFDLYLMHFPVSLEYVDPAHRYPPEWWGDDKKVHLGKLPIADDLSCCQVMHNASQRAYPRNLDRHGEIG